MKKRRERKDKRKGWKRGLKRERRQKIEKQR